MSYLLDTNIFSEIRKREKCNADVAAWFETVSADEIFLSALVLGEVRQGIERARRRDPAKAVALERWLTALKQNYADRILPIDAAVAELWGAMGVPDPIPTVDGLMAATAKAHGLTLVTRNIKDIKNTHVSFYNPFENPER